jgi:membrane protease YdiL (CAAX protease family)
VLTAALGGGRKGTRGLLRGFFKWRVGLRWYAAALVTLPLCSLGAAVVSRQFLGLPFAEYLAGWSVALGLINSLLYFTGIAEELGWRGYLLPRLLEDRSPLAASTVMGLVWWVWHAPICFLPQFRIVTEGLLFAAAAFAQLLVFLVLASVLMTWSYANASGNGFVAGGVVHATASAIPVSAQGGPYLAYLACLSVVIAKLWWPRGEPRCESRSNRGGRPARGQAAVLLRGQTPPFLDHS